MNSAASKGVPRLGINDLHIPQLGLGCSLYFAKIGQDQEIDLFTKAIDFGYRHFDTSQAYGTENSIGIAVQQKIAEGVIKREDVCIVTKLPPWAHRPENIRIAIDKTLKSLRMEYIDLYLIHSPFGFEPTKELTDEMDLEVMYKNFFAGDVIFDETDSIKTWKVLEKCVEDGILKNIGLSNFNSRQIQQILDNCTINPVNIQIESHPLFPNEELVRFCQNRSLTVTAHCPLGSTSNEKQNFVPLMEREEIKAIARKHNRSAAQILLRFQIQRNIIVIPCTTNSARLLENMSTMTWFHGDKHRGNAEVFDSVKPSHSMPTMTDNEVFDFTLDDTDMEAMFKMNENLRFREFPQFKKHKEYPFHEPY